MTHEPSGVAVTSLRGALESARSPEAAWEDLTLALSWLREYGVAPGTISGMSWNLFRASLSRPVVVGFDPEVGKAALFGGRQEVPRPGTYQHMVAADISAAYPTAMASSPYGLDLRSVSKQSHLDPSVPGIARARVWVDHDAPFAPLPIRLAPHLIQFQRGAIEGTWPWCELAAAQAVGFKVDVKEAWAPRQTYPLFATWWEMARTGRDLPTTGSKTLAKAIANSLWGQFAMDGQERGYTRWQDEKGERPYDTPQDPRNLPQRWTTHVAAETTARVRTRMLLEGLYPGGAGGSPVHVDTDGVLVRKSNTLPGGGGDGPGAWRLKAAMRRVDIRAPQLYRYQCTDGCGITHREWHYVAAGVTPESQESVFKQEAAAGGTRLTHRGDFDLCLPPEHIGDQAAIAQWVQLGKGRT